MKRFFLAAFSVLLATAAVAPTAQALPKIDTDFNIQTLRLSEFDARNKSEDSAQPYYYPEPSTQPASQTVSAEEERSQVAEPPEWENPVPQEDIDSPARSLTEQRHQSLDRN